MSDEVRSRLNSPPHLSGAARFEKDGMVSDFGWKDTVLAWPGKTVRTVIDFNHDFPGSQTHRLHCHNLEHEDAGMMGGRLISSRLAGSRLQKRFAAVSALGSSE